MSQSNVSTSFSKGTPRAGLATATSLSKFFPRIVLMHFCTAVSIAFHTPCPVGFGVVS